MLRIILLVISLALEIFLSSCADNPTAIKDVSLIANAGNDQSIIAGSYAIFDPTGSTGYYSWYQWVQDDKNPQKVSVYSKSKNEKNNKYNIDKIVFTKPGVYRFFLTVMDKRKSGSSEDNYSPSAPDTLTITVKPNLNPTFEDLNLEAIVRAKLKRQEGPLDNALSELDSLTLFEVVPQEKIKSLIGIEKCKNLIYLYISLQNISDISPLASLTKLKTLWMDQNRLISDLSPLRDLTEMEDLNISCNQITDITPLGKMTKLKYLNCEYNSIDDISAVKYMRNLKELWFSEAILKDLSPLSELTNLQLLWLNDCSIEDISYLKSLSNLIVLKIAYNSIKDISVLANMKKLQVFYSENNSITDISPLQYLPCLNSIRLWDNKITDIEPLVNNTYLSKGDIISLNGNPLSDKSLNTYIPILESRGIIVFFE